MKNSCTYGLTGLLAIAIAPALTAANWPGWRGANGTGVSTEKNLPLKWSTNENVRWRVELPGPGNSSPIVWGQRVFVTQAVNSESRRTLMCFDRASGKLLWQSGVTYAEKEPTQRDNPYCAATPVTDGERIIASFGSAGLYCYGFDGREQWHRDLGKMNHMFGNASSPVLVDDLCILNFGPDEKARLIAVNKQTGKIVWEVDPPKVDPSELTQGRFGGGGGGGRGGFGVGTTLAPQMFSQADKNADKKLSKDEFVSLANAWFDKLDPDKGGKLSQDQFATRFYDALPPREETGGPGDGPGGQGGRRGPSRTTAPAIFTVADGDKDGALTRAELQSTFAKWFDQWDSEKTSSLNEDRFGEGLNAVLPRPNFAGGGESGGPGGGGRGRPGGGRGGSWSTPLIITTRDRQEIVMNFPNRLAAYEPKTGQQLWFSKGLGETVYTTPLWGEGALVAMSTGNAIAVQPGGSDEVTESQRLWRLDRVKSAIGSGVIHEGHIYAVSQDGIAVCLDIKTGKTAWEERLKGSSSRNSSWSSAILADGKIYLPNQAGDVFVLRASPKFALLATNSVNEPTNASLAASDGELFLRTSKSLWCFNHAQ